VSVNFSRFVEKCHSNSLTLQAFDIAGHVLDLQTELGLLCLCVKSVSTDAKSRTGKTRPHWQSSRFDFKAPSTMLPNVRFIGKVLSGENISVGQNVIVVGPAIIGDNVKIEHGTVVNSSIIGSNVSVPPNQFIQNRVITSPEFHRKHKAESINNYKSLICPIGFLNRFKGEQSPFRTWPRFSYVRCIKRIMDFFIAVIVLAIFAPIIPFVALAIKINSPGTVFFKDRRQGLHGRDFYCLKFRTMTVGADKIQEKLRVVSEVDGPQFKIADDPRINTIGRFLRETYIDEIPQFFNVLIGQMSVVGPRPSPEFENTLCPSWRDARLSVRPGITGLWQVCRTRQTMRDFQEWIYYDTRYVRDLSLKLDLWISWQTIKKMVDKFITQF
jgi:lipopolysaccharide/colanic/teichoic acid biosynthesis glycosyltransferase